MYGRRVSRYWTNESVLAFAEDRDPIAAVEDAAQRLVMHAIEQGWHGPPFDPFELARIQGIPVEAHQELADARVVPAGDGGVRIEYNPTRPAPRLRFSLAHEIAHTLFPDVAAAARYRANPAAGPPDAWQLELLCNVAAAELIMPTDALSELRKGPLKIERLMELRRTYGVSTEALLRRAVKLTNRPLAMFAASRTNPTTATSPFRIDYTARTKAWDPQLPGGRLLPEKTVLAECTAIGFTAKREEIWAERLGPMRVQAVGAPAFPGHRFPRVLGLISPHGVRAAATNEVDVLHGDALKPSGAPPRVLVHLVNDKTPNWGRGFAASLRSRFPAAQDDFRDWVLADPTRLELGAAYVGEVADRMWVATIVGQRGYGPSKRPRIRYEAVRQALTQVAAFARDQGATVHMPRIGAGQAGGRWSMVRELVEQTMTREGIRVTVYVPPREAIDEPDAELTQLGLGI